MDQAQQTPAVTFRSPLQHLQIPIGIAKCQDWPTPDDLLDADRFAGTIIVVQQPGLAQDRQLAALVLKLRSEGSADHLFWRNAIDLIGKGTDERHLAA